MRKQDWFKSLFAPSLLSLTLTLSACGPQAFVPSGMTSKQSAAGTMDMPPKVDIVLGISMNGTMQNIYPGIQTEVPAFLQGLQNSGWDYRFIAIPLSEYQPTDASHFSIQNKVSVSSYDNNTASGNWLAPFPGANYADPTLGIASSLIAPLFTVPALDNSHNDGHESGIANQVNFLTRSDIQPVVGSNSNENFLRKDALLAVITLSNGDDRSGGSWVWDPVYQRTVWRAGAAAVDAGYENALRALKPTPELLKYYSLVAHLTNSCRGYGTWSGIRYEKISNDLGGKNIDICTTPLSGALSSVAQDLTVARINFKKSYLVMGTQPNVGTIKVIKHLGGNSGATVDIPQDPQNGWTYIGYQSNFNTVLQPIPMEPATGYMIQLHGTAILMGNDTAEISYQNDGTVASH